MKQRVATIRTVAIFFTFELAVAIFWSLRYCVNIDHRITTIRFVATIFNTELMVVIFFVRCDTMSIKSLKLRLFTSLR